jgi:hypothetical protein
MLEHDGATREQRPPREGQGRTSPKNRGGGWKYAVLSTGVESRGWGGQRAGGSGGGERGGCAGVGAWMEHGEIRSSSPERQRLAFPTVLPAVLIHLCMKCDAPYHFGAVYVHAFPSESTALPLAFPSPRLPTWSTDSLESTWPLAPGRCDHSRVLLPASLGGEVLIPTAVAAEIRPLAHAHCCMYLHLLCIAGGADVDAGPQRLCE